MIRSVTKDPFYANEDDSLPGEGTKQSSLADCGEDQDDRTVTLPPPTKKAKRTDWNKVPVTLCQSLSEAKKIIYNEHRSLKARGTKKKIVETTKVVTTSYQCLISSKIRGVCSAQIIQNTPHGDELSHAKATTYMVKVSRIDTCECHNLLTKIVAFIQPSKT